MIGNQRYEPLLAVQVFAPRAHPEELVAEARAGAPGGPRCVGGGCTLKIVESHLANYNASAEFLLPLAHVMTQAPQRGRKACQIPHRGMRPHGIDYAKHLTIPSADRPKP